MSDFDELSPEEQEQARIDKARQFLRDYNPPTIRIGDRVVNLAEVNPLTIGKWMRIEQKFKLKRADLLKGEPPIEKMARVAHMFIQEIDKDISFEDFIDGCKQSALSSIWNTIAKLELDDAEPSPT